MSNYSQQKFSLGADFWLGECAPTPSLRIVPVQQHQWC